MDELIFSQNTGFADFELTGDLVWPTGEEFEVWLQRNGYEFKWSFGHANANSVCHIDAYGRREGGEQPRYFVDVADAFFCQMIFVRDTASLMALRAQLAPLATAWLLEDLNQLRDIARLSFQAWHGHHVHAICDQCDPEEMKLQRQRKRERRSTDA